MAEIEFAECLLPYVLLEVKKKKINISLLGGAEKNQSKNSHKQ